MVSVGQFVFVDVNYSEFKFICVQFINSWHGSTCILMEISYQVKYMLNFWFCLKYLSFLVGVLLQFCSCLWQCRLWWPWAYLHCIKSSSGVLLQCCSCFWQCRLWWPCTYLHCIKKSSSKILEKHLSSNCWNAVVHDVPSVTCFIKALLTNFRSLVQGLWCCFA